MFVMVYIFYGFMYLIFGCSVVLFHHLPRGDTWLKKWIGKVKQPWCPSQKTASEMHVA